MFLAHVCTLMDGTPARTASAAVISAALSLIPRSARSAADLDKNVSTSHVSSFIPNPGGRAP
jgi:hypothetical protein